MIDQAPSCTYTVEMLLALAGLLLSAAPEKPAASDVVVCLAAWPGVIDQALARRLEAQTRLVLTEAGLSIVDRPAGVTKECLLDNQCLTRLGATANARSVLRLEPASVGKEVSVGVQVFSSADGKLELDEVLTIAVAAAERELPGKLGRTIAMLVTLRQRSDQSPPVEPSVLEKPVTESIPPPPPPPDPSPPRESPTNGRVAAWVVGGTGLAAAGAGGILAGIRASEAQGILKRYESGEVIETDATTVRKNLDRIATERNVGFVVLGVGVVALVAAAVLFNGSDASPVGAIIPTPGGVSAVVGGSF